MIFAIILKTENNMTKVNRLIGKVLRSGAKTCPDSGAESCFVS